MKQYIVTGMTCAACQARVEKAVGKLTGVKSVSVSLLTNSMGVEGEVSEADIIRAVEEAGYGASLKNAADKKENNAQGISAKLAAEEEALKDHETPRLVKRLVWSIGFLLILMYLTMGHNMLGLPVPAFLEHNHLGLALTQMLLAIIVMYINRAFFISGFRTLFRGPEHGYAGCAGIIGILWLVSICFLQDDSHDNAGDTQCGSHGDVSQSAVL